MTQPGTELRYPRPLAKTLTIILIYTPEKKEKHNQMYIEQLSKYLHSFNSMWTREKRKQLDVPLNL